MPQSLPKIAFAVALVFSFVQFAVGRESDFVYRLNRARNDTERVNIYKEAIRHYGVSDEDSIRYYGEMGIAYFRRHKEPLFEAQIMEQLALIDDKRGRTATARERMLYALRVYRELNYRPGIASAVGNVGALEAVSGKYDAAIKYMTESMDYADTTLDKDVFITGYMNLATLYLNIEEIASAEKYFALATRAAEGHKLTDKIISLYNLVGVMHAMKGENDIALKTFKHNLELSNGPAFTNAHLECMTYISQFYQENGEPEKALQYLRDGLKLATENKMAEIRSNFLQQMGAIEGEKNPEKAKQYLNEALAIATEMDNKVVIMTIFDNLASLHKQTHNYQEALLATERKHRISDSMLATNKAAELRGLLATWELEKSSNALADLELKHARNVSQRNFWAAVAIGVLVVVVVLLVFARRLMKLNARLRAHEESLQQVNAMKDKLFSIIAHDVRGPVARIPLLLDMIEDKDTTAEEKKFMTDSMRAHTHELIDMLEKMLMWGQALVKGNLLQQQSVSVDTCIRQDLSLNSLSLAEKKLTVDYLHDETARVLADPMHLDFIIRNLLANAIKYSLPGGAITIRLHHDKRPGYIVISVKDNGVGIVADRLPMVFHPVNSTPGTQNEKGTGIGLMLCREFALMNGGDIWVESEPGSGATFYLAFKVASAV